MSEIKQCNVSIECPCCGKVKDIFMTLEEYINYAAYQNGYGLIQQMLPNIPAADRELLAGGMCGECWKEKFVIPPCEYEDEDNTI